MLITNTYNIFGQLLNTVTPDAAVEFEYDLCGRPAAEVQNGLRVEYAYHPQGDLARRHFEGSKTGPLLFEYDKRRRLISIGSENRSYQRYEYDNADLLTASDFGASVETLVHDTRRRVKSLSVNRSSDQQKILSRQFAYDAEDNLILVSDSLRGNVSYEYDADEQLLKTTHSKRGIVDYQYDACGNLIQKGSTPLVYDRGNVLVQNGAAFYERDANGNIIVATVSGQSTRFIWDALGQLVQVLHHDGSKTTFGYDGIGRRVFKEHRLLRTKFYWAGDDLLSEQTADTVTDYAIGEFIPDIIWENGEIRHVIISSIAMPYELLDEQGRIVWWGEYDDWGLLTHEMASGASNRLRLPGQYFDAELTLHYNRFRYYSPTDGRFISPDPVGLVGGFNEFLYARNLINWTDPLGLECGNTRCPKNSVYVLLLKGKIVYVGISAQKFKARLSQHIRKGKKFDSATLIQTGLTKRKARNIEGSALHHIGTSEVDVGGRLQNERRNDRKTYYHSYSATPAAPRVLLSVNETVKALNQNVLTIKR
jgi:RHS repeat-associated protein